MRTKGSFRKSIILISIMMISGFTFFAEQSFAQEANKGKQTKPDVKIKVNKEFDNKGNITRYDSTYSYTWSNNGQMPTNIDSVFVGFNHNFKFGGDLDSMFNNFGSNWPFEGNDLFSQPFSHQDKRLEEFFRNHQLHKFPSDSTLGCNPHDFFNRDFKEMLKQHQRLMDDFFHQFNSERDSLITPPIDTLPSKVIPKSKIKIEKQNEIQNSKPNKTISV
jgi:hypothetical protein